MSRLPAVAARGAARVPRATSASALPRAGARASSLLAGSLSLAAAAVAGSYALRAYNAVNAPEGSAAGAAAGGGGASASHKAWGAEALARRFYRGPFEDKMSRREAALVLGVRESAAPERIRERYKKMLLLNHPDVGGSTFLAGKVNEAKDILLGRTKP